MTYELQADGTLLLTSRSGEVMRFRKTELPRRPEDQSPIWPYWRYPHLLYDGIWWEQIEALLATLELPQ